MVVVVVGGIVVTMETSNVMTPWRMDLGSPDPWDTEGSLWSEI